MASAVLGNPRDAVTSLAPRDMALGQIVPFEVEIKVTGNTSPEAGKIQIVGRWNTKTTSGNNFGYDPSFGVYCAFIDTADTDNVSLAASTRVDSFSSTTIGVGGSNEQIQGRVDVSGLVSGETAVLEIWVVLKDGLPSKLSGNVQTNLQSAKTCVTQNPCAGGSSINTGNQTVPLLQVNRFTSRNNPADVSVVKSDSPDPVSLGDTLNYTVNVTNTSVTTIANGVVLTDTLDPNVAFVSSSFANPVAESCNVASGVITCNVGALSQGQVVPITITMTVNDNAPTNNTIGASEIGGTCTQGSNLHI